MNVSQKRPFTRPSASRMGTHARLPYNIPSDLLQLPEISPAVQVKYPVGVPNKSPIQDYTPETIVSRPHSALGLVAYSTEPPITPLHNHRHIERPKSSQASYYQFDSFSFLPASPQHSLHTPSHQSHINHQSFLSSKSKETLPKERFCAESSSTQSQKKENRTIKNATSCDQQPLEAFMSVVPIPLDHGAVLAGSTQAIQSLHSLKGHHPIYQKTSEYLQKEHKAHPKRIPRGFYLANKVTMDESFNTVHDKPKFGSLNHKTVDKLEPVLAFDQSIFHNHQRIDHRIIAPLPLKGSKDLDQELALMYVNSRLSETGPPDPNSAQLLSPRHQIVVPGVPIHINERDTPATTPILATQELDPKVLEAAISSMYKVQVDTTANPALSKDKGVSLPPTPSSEKHQSISLTIPTPLKSISRKSSTASFSNKPSSRKQSLNPVAGPRRPSQMVDNTGNNLKYDMIRPGSRNPSISSTRTRSKSNSKSIQNEGSKKVKGKRKKSMSVGARLEISEGSEQFGNGSVSDILISYLRDILFTVDKSPISSTVDPCLFHPYLLLLSTKL
eukprot:TRINITY_DN6184_c0_g1_i1.p1 TRINITY_DN6184_c0_g1~~TRINITY_DN6184_c0_g1_i1.p1  ORF type:complete len:558 (-),score=106.99 TRINITY_DN6184_c0_g1_i1:961-2634(-)